MKKEIDFDNGSYTDEINGVKTSIKLVKKEDGENSDNGTYPEIFEASTNFPLGNNETKFFSAEHTIKEKAVKALIMEIKEFVNSK